MQTNLTLFQRLTSPIPAFFRKMQLFILVLTGIDGLLAAYLKINYPDSKFTIMIITFGVTLGSIGTFLVRLPVDFDKYKEQLKTQLAALDPIVDEVKPLLPEKAQEVINNIETEVNVQENTTNPVQQ